MKNLIDRPERSTEVPERIVSLLSQKMRSWYSFIRIRIEEAGLSGLDISHGDILYQLYTHGAMPMSVLAQRIKKDKSTVTALVKKMESRKLIKRVPDKDDARVAIVELTSIGESYRDAFAKISHDLLERIYRNLTDKERIKLMELLVKCGE